MQADKPVTQTTHRMMIFSKDDEKMFMSIDLTPDEATAIFDHCGVAELDNLGDFEIDCYVQIGPK